MSHILLDTNGCIEPCISTQLVHDLYLNRMEGHLVMINCDKILCKKIIFALLFFPQVVALALGPWNVSMFESFNHTLHWCTNI